MKKITKKKNVDGNNNFDNNSDEYNNRYEYNISRSIPSMSGRSEILTLISL